jgi:hypothetical protein
MTQLAIEFSGMSIVAFPRAGGGEARGLLLDVERHVPRLIVSQSQLPIGYVPAVPFEAMDVFGGALYFALDINGYEVVLPALSDTGIRLRGSREPAQSAPPIPWNNIPQALDLGFIAAGGTPKVNFGCATFVRLAAGEIQGCQPGDPAMADTTWHVMEPPPSPAAYNQRMCDRVGFRADLLAGATPLLKLRKGGTSDIAIPFRDDVDLSIMLSSLCSSSACQPPASGLGDVLLYKSGFTKEVDIQVPYPAANATIMSVNHTHCPPVYFAFDKAPW